MKKSLLFLFVIVIVVAIAYSFLRKGHTAAPQVSYHSIIGAQKTDTKALLGKVVLVNFWATSCSGCIEEMPHLKAIHEKYNARGYETIAVAMQFDHRDYIINFVQKNALPFFVTHDQDGQIAKAFGDIQLTPTSFLIDKKGTIIRQYTGQPDFKELTALIEKSL